MTLAELPHAQVLHDPFGPRKGLVLWLPMRGNALDLSGNGNHGTVAGATLAADRWGRSNRAYSFDMIDDVITAVAAASINDLAQLTLAAWIKPGSAGEDNFGRILDKAAGITNGWLFYVTLDNRLTFRQDYDGAADLIKSSAASLLSYAGTWQHVAVTWDGGILRANAVLYLNGVEMAVTSGTDGVGSRVTDAAQNLLVGNNSTTASTFNGPIADVRVYNRVLSAKDIWRLYTARVP